MGPLAIAIVVVLVVILLYGLVISTYMLAVPIEVDLSVTDAPVEENNIKNLSDVNADDVTALDTLVYDADSDVFIGGTALVADPTEAAKVSLENVNANLRDMSIQITRFANIAMVQLHIEFDASGSSIATDAVMGTVPLAYRPAAETGVLVAQVGGGTAAALMIIGADGVVTNKYSNYGPFGGDAYGETQYILAA